MAVDNKSETLIISYSEFFTASNQDGVMSIY